MTITTTTMGTTTILSFLTSTPRMLCTSRCINLRIAKSWDKRETLEYCPNDRTQIVTA